MDMFSSRRFQKEKHELNEDEVIRPLFASRCIHTVLSLNVHTSRYIKAHRKRKVSPLSQPSIAEVREPQKSTYKKMLAPRDPESSELRKIHGAKWLAPLEKGSKEGNHVYRHETGSVARDSIITISQTRPNPYGSWSRDYHHVLKSPSRICLLVPRSYVCMRVCMCVLTCVSRAYTRSLISG